MKELTKEEDAYNKGYNAALTDFFMALDDYDIEVTTDDKYLTNYFDLVILLGLIGCAWLFASN